MIARYDRELAGVLFEPAWKAATAKKLAQPYNLAIVAAVLKPREAAMILEKLPNDAETANVRCRLAGTLTRDDDNLWARWQNTFLGLWTVDVEEVEEGMDD